MARLLFTVEDSFLISGRGIVLVPGIVPESDEPFKAGNPLLLKRPDGSELPTTISAFEIVCPNPENAVPILLQGLSKADVPIVTNVWTVDDN